MRSFHILLLVVLTVLAFTAKAAGSFYQGEFPAQTSAFTATSLRVEQQARDIWIFRPSNAVNPPLLIFFSGTGGTLANSTLDELGKEFVQDFAEREGVVVAMPLPRTIDRADWDHAAEGYLYWETASTSGRDSPVSRDPQQNNDLLLTQAIINEAKRVYRIDPDRIYLSGFSSGAFFSYFAAAVLHEQVAAFAETGGGLVMSHTTGGDPLCQINPLPANAGAVRNCAATGWTANSCVSAGAIPRPISAESVDWVPPGFLQANDDDDSVPFAHTCNLAAALSTLGEHEVRIIHAGGGHVIGENFWRDAWEFLKNKRLATALQKAADQVFNYAERQYAPLFAPANAKSAIGYGYYYRFYPGTNSYLGLQNQSVYYFLPGVGLREAGPLRAFLPLARALK